MKISLRVGLLSIVVVLLIVASQSVTTIYGGIQKGDVFYAECLQSPPGTRPQFVEFNSSGDIRFTDCTNGQRLIVAFKGNYFNDGCQKSVIGTTTISGVQYKVHILHNVCFETSSVTLFRDDVLIASFTPREVKTNNCVCID